MEALLLDVLQHLVDVLARQLALGAEHQVEGMLRWAEHGDKRLGHTGQGFALVDV